VVFLEKKKEKLDEMSIFQSIKRYYTNNSTTICLYSELYDAGISQRK
jgi:predicted nucleic-acid-binding Zn-ribbon protein